MVCSVNIQQCTLIFRYEHIENTFEQHSVKLLLVSFQVLVFFHILNVPKETEPVYVYKRRGFYSLY